MVGGNCSMAGGVQFRFCRYVRGRLSSFGLGSSSGVVNVVTPSDTGAGENASSLNGGNAVFNLSGASEMSSLNSSIGLLLVSLAV